MGGHQDQSGLRGGGVVERSLVPPASLLVEGSGPCVARHDGKPGLGVSVGCDLPFGFSHQDGSNARSSVAGRDVDLLYLIVDDHDKSHDVALDSGDGGVSNPIKRTGAEGFFSSSVNEILGDETEVAVLPTVVPDLGDLIRIFRNGFANGYLRLVRITVRCTQDVVDRTSYTIDLSCLPLATIAPTPRRQ